MRRRHPLHGLSLVLLGAAIGAGAALIYVAETAPLAPRATIALPDHPPIQVSFGPAFLTALLRDALRHEAPAFTDLVVTVRGGRLVARANVEIFGQRTSARVVLRPTLVAGHVHVGVARVTVGTIEFPLEATLDRAIDDRLHALLTGLPVTIAGLAVDPDRGLIVTCNVDLAALAPFDNTDP